MGVDVVNKHDCKVIYIHSLTDHWFADIRYGYVVLSFLVTIWYDMIMYSAMAICSTKMFEM